MAASTEPHPGIDAVLALLRSRRDELEGLGEVRVRLAEALQCQVDVLIADDLTPALRRTIDRDLVAAF
jgi:predicted nucleotidyltransferase